MGEAGKAAARQEVGLHSLSDFAERTYLHVLALVLVAVIPFFFLFIPSSNRVILVVILALLLFCVVQGVNDNAALSAPLPVIALVLFYVFVLVNNNVDLVTGTDRRWVVLFGGIALSLFVLSGERRSRWPDIVLRCIAVFGLFYGCATIIFWLAPQLYDAVYPYLLSKTSASRIVGSGYRAGLTTHYSTNGIYIALGFLACAALALREKRAFWKVAAAVALFALVLTTKRAHLAFSIVSFAVMYFGFNSNKPLGSFAKFLLIVAAAAIAFYLASFFNEDVLAVLDRFSGLSDDDSFGGRSGFYELCLTMWFDSPLVGNGWGSYTEAFNRTWEGLSYISQGFTTMDAHNVYLQVLAEEGMVGMALFLGFVAGGIVATVRRILAVNRLGERGDAMYEARCILVGSLGIQVFFALYCITGNPLYDMQVYVPYLLSLGMAYAAVPADLLDVAKARNSLATSAGRARRVPRRA